MSDQAKVTVRAAGRDQFAGLRGHAYIAARGLTSRSTCDRSHVCPTCQHAEMLPAVLNIIEGWKQ